MAANFDDSGDEMALHSDGSDSDEMADDVGRRPRTFRPRINFDLAEFRERFRLTEAQAETLINTIGAALRHPTDRNCALSPRQQVLLCLRFYADGGHLRTLGDAHGVSKATVSRCIHRVTAEINRALFAELVDWPPEAQRRYALPHQFQQATGSQMPSVCGCVDGTHVPILAPSEHERQFVNRHHTHSLNCMMVCGPRMQFFYVSARWPGSVHDARVMRNSSLATRFGNGWRPFPNAVLLADSAYAASDWVIPCLRHTRNDAEEDFNRHHKRMRRLIECAYGLLSARFRCLNYLRVEPLFACEVVKAVATLHNLILSLRPEEMPVAAAEQDDDGDDDEAVAAANVGNQNNARRLQMIQAFVR